MPQFVGGGLGDLREQRGLDGGGRHGELRPRLRVRVSSDVIALLCWIISKQQKLLADLAMEIDKTAVFRRKVKEMVRSGRDPKCRASLVLTRCLVVV